jgi:radical SAM superfamily enzyme YgiQ (UPF0313 family)
MTSLSGYDVGDFRMAGLGVATAMGALPEGHDVSLIDQNVAPVDYECEADTVCLSFFTPQASGAYEIADRFRSRGVPVIAGGIHPTMAPEDTLGHVDAVVRGPVEGLWPQILADVTAGTLATRYEGRLDAPFAPPRRDLFKRSTYLRAGVVQTARGCTRPCPFCVVPRCYGQTITYRPIDEVVADIAGLPYPSFFFGDESLLFDDPVNVKYTRELAATLIEKNVRRYSFMANYPHIIKKIDLRDAELLARAGLRQIYLVMGLYAPLKSELADGEVRRAMAGLKDAGIEVLATFTLGHDDDDRPVESLIAEFCAATKTNLAEFTISVPFPGTATFEELDRQGRILTRDWGRYNAGEVVFAPRHESAEALERRFLDLWKWFYERITPMEIRMRYARAFGATILRSDHTRAAGAGSPSQ